MKNIYIPDLPPLLTIKNVVAKYLIDEKGKDFTKNDFANYCFTNDIIQIILKEFPELKK